MAGERGNEPRIQRKGTNPPPATPKERAWSEHHQQLAHDPKPELAHGTAVCSRCRAVWHEKRWHVESPKLAHLLSQAEIAAIVCPACHQLEEGLYDGEVLLEGEVLRRERAAAMGLIHHVEQAVRMGNPMNRIGALDPSEGSIVVHTIGRFLAERIGKEFLKAYHGTLTIDRQKDGLFVRVRWTT